MCMHACYFNSLASPGGRQWMMLQRGAMAWETIIVLSCLHGVWASNNLSAGVWSYTSELFKWLWGFNWCHFGAELPISVHVQWRSPSSQWRKRVDPTARVITFTTYTSGIQQYSITTYFTTSITTSNHQRTCFTWFWEGYATAERNRCWKRITFKLINQKVGEDIVYTFQPDPSSCFFNLIWISCDCP